LPSGCWSYLSKGKAELLALNPLNGCSVDDERVSFISGKNAKLQLEP
jgi:hypothetical protein